MVPRSPRRRRAARARCTPGRSHRAPRPRRRRHLGRPGRRPGAGAPALVHPRPQPGRPPADALARRPLGGRLQRRALQPPRAACRTRGPRRTLPQPQRHRSAGGRHRALGRRGHAGARQWHAGAGGLGPEAARTVAGARPPGQEAAVLRLDRRRQPGVRQRTGRAARPPGPAPEGGPGCAGAPAALRLHPGAVVDPARRAQAPGGFPAAPGHGRAAHGGHGIRPARRAAALVERARSAARRHRARFRRQRRRSHGRVRRPAPRRHRAAPRGRRAAGHLPLGRHRFLAGDGAAAGAVARTGAQLLDRFRQRGARRERARGRRGPAPGHRAHRTARGRPGRARPGAKAAAHLRRAFRRFLAGAHRAAVRAGAPARDGGAVGRRRRRVVLRVFALRPHAAQRGLAAPAAARGAGQPRARPGRSGAAGRPGRAARRAQGRRPAGPGSSPRRW